jgi:hypothetical protein
MTAKTDGAGTADEAKRIEERAAEVRLRLMQTMDALGHKRRALALASQRVLEKGSKVLTLSGVVLVAATGLGVALAVYSGLARARRRSAVLRLWSLVPALEWRRPTPPRPEPSVWGRLASSLLMGMASTGLKLVMRQLATTRPMETETERGDTSGLGRDDPSKTNR